MVKVIVEQGDQKVENTAKHGMLGVMICDKDRFKIVCALDGAVDIIKCARALGEAVNNSLEQLANGNDFKLLALKMAFVEELNHGSFTGNIGKR